MRKWTKDMNRCFTEEDMQMNNKHMKRCLHHLALRKCNLNSLLACMFKVFAHCLIQCSLFLYYCTVRNLGEVLFSILNTSPWQNMRFVTFFSVCGLSFHCLSNAFWRKEALNFAVVQFYQFFFYRFSVFGRVLFRIQDIFF